MKTPSSKKFFGFLSLCSAIWALGPPSPAASPDVLAIQTYAGLSITGTVGAVYAVEYSTDLAQADSWLCADFVSLPSSPYLWIDKSTSVAGKRFYRAGQVTAPTHMLYLSPGTFRMGSPADELDRNSGLEGQQTVVTLTRGFWIAKYEVTQAEYLAVMGNNPSTFNGMPGAIDYGIDLTRPVETVTWTNATAYCAALTTSERAAGRINSNCAYRLPTEAEWEYACRAMTSTRFSYGDDLPYTSLTNYAWYSTNSTNRTHPIGTKLPNPWGLYDMHGNVAEWCQDVWWNLPGGALVDPQHSGGNVAHIIRGGSYENVTSTSRAAFRAFQSFGSAFSTTGFRVVLAPVQP